jgi:epsilon-lactone hydrolase
MTVLTHDEHLLDRAAMVAVRGFMAASTPPAISPEGRPGYDDIMARTPAPDGVDWTAGAVSGVPGWWSRPANAAPGRAILYLHGGCYVLGSAAAYRGLASQIAARAEAATFVADYRLAPEHPFPAAFDDARRALDDLHEEGFGQVAVAGDSAGGGLALAMLISRQLRRPLAGAAVLSPWLDLTLSGETLDSRSASDPILSRASLEQGVRQYLGDADARDPRASPLWSDLSALPPVRIDVGSDEVLLDDSLRFEASAVSSGSQCEVHVWNGMVHVFPSNVSMLKAAPEALDGAGTFLRRTFEAANLPR